MGNMAEPNTPSLHIPRSLLRVMLAHGQAEYPLEACGLLGGRNGRVYHLYTVENQLRSPVRYEMDPLQQIQALLHMEDAGNELLAIYHTHPHGPETPSPTDVSLATFPEAIYIIVSLADRTAPVVRGYFIKENSVFETSLIIYERLLNESN